MIDNFRGHHSFLSNFYPVKIFLWGIEYQTAEHAYQCQKTTTNSDWQMVYYAATPGLAKRIARCVAIRSDWDKYKLVVMREVLACKFSEERMTNLLLSTGTQELVEGNAWNDRFWGVCRGVGQNYLGKLLMELRENIRTIRAQQS